MGQKTIFRQISRLASNIEGKTEDSEYEHRLIFYLLEQNGQNATLYDKQLKMYFENTSALANVYDLEIDKVKLFLSPSFEGATDLSTRMMYLFDWLQLSVGFNGKVKDIHNPNELRSNWERQRTRLLRDYTGEGIQNHVQKVDEKMAATKTMGFCLHAYFDFALIFPRIPVYYSSDWMQKRRVLLSDFEGCFFEETLRFEKIDAGKRIYSISVASLSESKWTIENSAGEFVFLENELLPDQGRIRLTLYDSSNLIFNEWHFSIQKVML